VGGDTNFPRLNITVPPTPLAALVFDNCLRNGEPDERTLHEGIEPSGGAVKCEQLPPSLPCQAAAPTPQLVSDVLPRRCNQRLDALATNLVLVTRTETAGVNCVMG